MYIHNIYVCTNVCTRVHTRNIHMCDTCVTHVHIQMRYADRHIHIVYLRNISAPIKTVFFFNFCSTDRNIHIVDVRNISAPIQTFFFFTFSARTETYTFLTYATLALH